MIWNILLLLVLFGAPKLKINQYAAAAVLGLVKGVLYFFGSRGSIPMAMIGFLLFGGLAAGMVWLLRRLDRKDAAEEPYPRYGSKRKTVFKWEYIPLSAVVAFLLFGEMMLTILFAHAQVQGAG